MIGKVSKWICLSTMWNWKILTVEVIIIFRIKYKIHWKGFGVLDESICW